MIWAEHEYFHQPHVKSRKKEPLRGAQQVQCAHKGCRSVREVGLVRSEPRGNHGETTQCGGLLLLLSSKCGVTGRMQSQKDPQVKMNDEKHLPVMKSGGLGWRGRSKRKKQLISLSWTGLLRATENWVKDTEVMSCYKFSVHLYKTSFWLSSQWHNS